MTEIVSVTDARIGVIGGSGVYKLDGFKIVREVEVRTPFGIPSDKILEMEFVENSKKYSFYFLPRHGRNHTISPSEINYRANIFALKKLGVKHVVSVSAVGSLKEELPPTTFVLVDQFIDWTKGLRERTFFGNGLAGHVSVALPVEPGVQERIVRICENKGVKFSKGGTYVCIEGPQFSSQAESNVYRSFGASVIGMTNVPEAYLAKEAGIAYATIAMVTDYDCWKDVHCSVDEVVSTMKSNYQSLQKIFAPLISNLIDEPVHFTADNQSAVMTDPAKITPQHKELLDVLLR